MSNTEIRIIEPQKVETEREITGYEAEEILKKYGYVEEYSSIPKAPIKEVPKLSFEDMIKAEQNKIKEEEERKIQRQKNKPKTFDSSSGYDTKIQYGTDDELGFSFKIEISSDMKLPRY